MRSSLLIGATLLLATLLGVLFVSFTGGEPTVHATGPAAKDEPRPAARPAAEIADVGTPALPETRTAVDEAAIEEAESARQAATVVAGEGEPVVVRVKVTRADGTPQGFGGLSVEAQSWISASDEVTLHTAEVDAENMAEFRFPGDVHLDFVRLLPPRDLGLALAYVEDHIDLEPGDEYTPVLEVAPGGELAGRVLDDFDLPVQGVRVHAYSADSWSDLSDWDPGLVWTETGPDGRFRLPLLPEGSWGLAVEPDGWLQVDPSLDDVRTGTTWFELEVGDRIEGGDIVITSLHRLNIEVVDGAGRPAPHANVWLEPVSFRSPRMAPKSMEPLDEVELFLSGETRAEPADGPLPWPYDVLSWTTDEDGRVKALGITGSWNLRVRPNLGRSEETLGEVVVPLELPAPDQVVVLATTLWTFAGKLVDVEGGGIAGATLRLTRDAQGSSTTMARSEGSGAFEFEGLPPGGDLTLHALHGNYVEASWHVAAEPAAEPPEFALARAASLRLRVVDPAGKGHSRKRLKLVSGQPHEALAPSQVEPFERMMSRTTQRISSRTGTTSFSRLPPGRYVVALVLPVASGETGSNGWAQTEWVEYVSWKLETSGEQQTVVADLSGYVPPVSRTATRHHGVVRDAATGRPLPAALVRIENESMSNWSRTDEEGRFATRTIAASFRVHVMCEGYLPHHGPLTEYGPGDVLHEIDLHAGGHPLVVRVVDARGEAVPALRVAFQAEDGSSLLCNVLDEDGDLVWRDSVGAPDGRVEFANSEPGPLKLELSIAGHVIANPTVEVLGGRAPQEAEVALEVDLDQLRSQLRAAIEGD